MKCRLIKDNILVLPDDPVKITDEGVVIPTVALEKQFTGTVEAVGPDCKTIHVGDRISWLYEPPKRILFEGKDFALLAEDDIALIFDD